MSHRQPDLRISWDTAKHTNFPASPVSDCTVDDNTFRSMSPIELVVVPAAIRTPSPKPLAENPDFVPIDDEGYKQRWSENSLRPIFEHPRRAPTPPRHSPLPSATVPNNNMASTSLLDGDVCTEDGEDFLQFLSKTGYMAADRRTSSIRRDSVSTNSMTASSRGSAIAAHRLSGAGGASFTASRPSSLILDSRRTSLALRRASSSGVLSPILQDDVSLAAFENDMNNITRDGVPPMMEREDTLAKMIAQMRFSADFSVASTSLATPSSEEDSFFQARRKSSVDFTDLEILLARACNPLLTQLHRTYTAQFEMMAQQIAALNMQVEELKQSQAEDRRFDREISLDVFSSTASENLGQQHSISSHVSSGWRATTSIDARTAEQGPFWREQLQRAGEYWDQGGWEDFRRDSLRCISPRTRC